MKRGTSGLSMVLGVIKPSGMTSHDVVSKVRRIFNEKRVGHAGTLDPFATGVLPVLVGPATRLNKYMASHDKSYVAEIEFGTSTSTDDRCGEVLHRGEVPADVKDRAFAERLLYSFLGKSMQMPPAYSAIKVGGKKACDEARKGNIITLEPRPIEVYAARLINICEVEDKVIWKVAFHVSKGTYIRALARDIGKRVGVPAHLRELERESVGCISMEDCCPLDKLEQRGASAAIDPIALLGMRVLFVNEEDAQRISHGGFVGSSDRIAYKRMDNGGDGGCSCLAPFVESTQPMEDGEAFAIVSENKLIAIYVYVESDKVLKPDCVFQEGISRGADIQPCR